MKPKYRSKATADPQAIELNHMMDDVARSVTLGRYLDNILQQRFAGDLKKFARWIKDNLDRDGQTVARKILLARNSDLLKKAGIVRLQDAYQLLDLLGSIKLSKLRDPI